MRNSKMRLVALLSMVLAIVLTLGACSSGGMFTSEIDEETGAVHVTADNADKGTSAGSLGGGLLIEEGQIVVVSPDFEKGGVQLQLLDVSGEKVLDETIEGRQLTTYELEPGDYSIGSTCIKNGTTGTMLVVAVDAAEFEQQNQDLAAILGSAGE